MWRPRLFTFGMEIGVRGGPLVLEGQDEEVGGFLTAISIELFLGFIVSSFTSEGGTKPVAIKWQRTTSSGVVMTRRWQH